MTAAIVIGTSYGGLEAIKAIVPKLPANFNIPILIVLHIGHHKNDSFIEHLNHISFLRVKEAEEKEEIKGGTIYFAPPNYHLLVEDDQLISLTTDEKVHHSRPSIDVLFESAAWAYKNQLMGIVLSGLNQDGADGLKTIKDCGGITIVQDPEDALADIMPLEAIKTAEPDHILPVDLICDKILKLMETNSTPV